MLEKNSEYNIENVKGEHVVIGANSSINIGLSVEEVTQLAIELKNEAQPQVWDGRYPYIGLAAFQESDAQFFYGREKLIDELLDCIQESNFITIAGPSGSGKSSVARAGLFYALRSGRIEKSEDWLLATMNPQGDPVEQLAQALTVATQSVGVGGAIRAAGLEPKEFQQQIEMYLGSDQRRRLVLLIDQFEELFTQTKSPHTQAAFIHLITTITQTTNSRIIVVLAMRSDFISHCATHPELRTLMSQQFQLVGAMSPQELTKAITLPCLEVGAEIDPELVSRILTDMKGEPGALPLMSFALRDLFDQEKSAIGEQMDLTLKEYLDAGGIEQALERHAEQVFNNFTPDQKEVAKNIFSKLIETGQGRVDTRRTATLAELIPSGSTEEETLAVIELLAREGSRLITASASETDVTSETPSTITIAHEKLIDAWPWLRQLVDENRELISLQNQIFHDAQNWIKTDDKGYLYRGGRLLQIEEQIEELTPYLNENSRKFVDASIRQRQQELDEAKAQQIQALEQAQLLAEEQKQRAEAEQRRNVVFQRALWVGSFLLLFAVIAIVFAVNANNDARASAIDAVNSEGTAVAEATRAFQNSSTAVAEATRAYQNLSTAEAAKNEASIAVATIQYLATIQSRNETDLAKAQEDFDNLVKEANASDQELEDAQEEINDLIAISTRNAEALSDAFNSELGDTQLRGIDGMLMVFVPGGTFTMGSNPAIDADAELDEQPQHQVALNSFWMDQTEVTNAQFDLFVRETNYETTAESAGTGWILTNSSWQETAGADWQHPSGAQSNIFGLDDHPVVLVSWNDANAYCTWAGGTLPTEAQWEYAARGTDGRIYPWGNNFDGAQVNSCDTNCNLSWSNLSNDGYSRTSPVGTYSGDSWVKAEDMGGNAREWVSDWYDSDYYFDSPRDNPTGPSGGEYKVLRGGSWGSGYNFVRTTIRNIREPDYRSDVVGFRCVVPIGN